MKNTKIILVLLIVGFIIIGCEDKGDCYICEFSCTEPPNSYNHVVCGVDDPNLAQRQAYDEMKGKLNGQCTIECSLQEVL